MAFDWKEFFVLAQELGKRNDEAALRTAISRAYYAAYCKARNLWIQENGPIPLDVNTHQFVWNPDFAQTSAKSLSNTDIRPPERCRKQD